MVKPATFADHYQELQKAAAFQQGPAADHTAWPKITRSWLNDPVPVVLHILAEMADVSIVADASLDSQMVSMDVVDMPLPDVLAVMARRLGVDVSHQGRLFYMGRLRPQDRGFLVRRVRALTLEELNNAVGTVKSQDGQAHVMGNGVVVVSDRVEVLQQVSAMLDAAEAATAEAAEWCVQLYLVSTSDTFLSDLGIDATPAIDLAATYAWASGGAAQNQSILTGGLTALLHASRTSAGASIVAQPLLLLRDGTTASFNRGQRVPLAKRAVSDQGTVTTTGFDFLQTGLVITAAVREVTQDRCSLKVAVSLSTVDSFDADGAPLTTQSAIEGVAEVHSGGVYLLGSLDLADKAESRSGWLRWGSTQTDNHHQFQLWCRVVRVGGSARREPSPEAPRDVRQPGKTDVSKVEPSADRRSDAILEMPKWQPQPIGVQSAETLPFLDGVLFDGNATKTNPVR
ncbi:MAG: type II and III secretion system protein [Planctomycetia bacterium]|nr:type II and III secretion system protein [Planctomycetia bacterium]